jgi:iron complex transport system substrate-binding protein
MLTLPRRSRLSRHFSVGVAAALLLVVSACGSDTDPSPSTSNDDATGDVAADESVFPVTVDHKFGQTVVEAPPERIVTVGVTEQDNVLALGVTPVGVTEWYGEHPYATWPWAQDELGDAQPDVLSTADGLQFERIAALQPDLIVGTNAGLTKQDYEKLSALAPTVAQSGDYSDYFEPWDVQHVAIGTALGKETEATEQVEAIKGEFADAAAEHPEFAGVPAVFLQNAFYDGSAIAYQDGLSTDFLTDLGFVVPKEIDEYAEGGGQAYIPLENLNVLNNADVLLWATEKDSDRANLEKEGVYRNLDAVKGGNLAFTDDVLAGAIYFTSPLSLPYVLDELVPRLATAVEGEPSLAPAA